MYKKISRVLEYHPSKLYTTRHTQHTRRVINTLNCQTTDKKNWLKWQKHIFIGLEYVLLFYLPNVDHAIWAILFFCIFTLRSKFHSITHWYNFIAAIIFISFFGENERKRSELTWSIINNVKRRLIHVINLCANTCVFSHTGCPVLLLFFSFFRFFSKTLLFDFHLSWATESSFIFMYEFRRKKVWSEPDFSPFSPTINKYSECVQECGSILYIMLFAHFNTRFEKIVGYTVYFLPHAMCSNII